ncbi:hypothetical protein ACQKK5_23660 [Brevibacillus panacihumi]|uniref:hypothetical protein n=1 Tax=Brevibacillus panacihumi TaxID=497735 RepID=UPI003D062BF5
MTKKEYVLTVVDNLLKHQEILPSELQNVLQEVKNDIEHVSADTFYLETNMVMTELPHERRPNVDAPFFRLSEAYSDLKDLAEQNQDAHPEFFSAVTQLEGLLDASKGYFPE